MARGGPAISASSSLTGAELAAFTYCGSGRSSGDFSGLDVRQSGRGGFIVSTMHTKFSYDLFAETREEKIGILNEGLQIVSTR
jgi:hypothetical protein